MSKHSWNATKRLVYERAHGCCEYCHTCEYNTGQAMHIEHINPSAGDDLENLCLSCPSCNMSKATALTADDPESGETLPLFNPRTQVWNEHFEWLDGGLRLRGKTPVGRATIERLKMNHPRLVRARNNLIAAGTHPPSEKR